MVKLRWKRAAARLALFAFACSSTTSWAAGGNFILPEDGTVVGGSNIACVAEFHNTVRPVTRIDFLVDGQRLTGQAIAPNEAPQATFLWDATGVDAGQHKLTVRAYSGSQLVASDSIQVLVAEDKGPDVLSPQVHILFPRANSTVTGQTPIQLQAFDNSGVAMISLFIDRQLKLIQNVPPFTYLWDTTAYENGPHVIEAWAFDGAQNRGLAKPVRVMVNNPGGFTALEEEPAPAEAPKNEVVRVPGPLSAAEESPAKSVGAARPRNGAAVSAEAEASAKPPAAAEQSPKPAAPKAQSSRPAAAKASKPLLMNLGTKASRPAAKPAPAKPAAPQRVMVAQAPAARKAEPAVSSAPLPDARPMLARALPAAAAREVLSGFSPVVTAPAVQPKPAKAPQAAPAKPSAASPSPAVVKPDAAAPKPAVAATGVKTPKPAAPAPAAKSAAPAPKPSSAVQAAAAPTQPAAPKAPVVAKASPNVTASKPAPKPEVAAVPSKPAPKPEVAAVPSKPAAQPSAASAPKVAAPSKAPAKPVLVAAAPRALATAPAAAAAQPRLVEPKAAPKPAAAAQAPAPTPAAQPAPAKVQAPAPQQRPAAKPTLTAPRPAAAAATAPKPAAPKPAAAKPEPAAKKPVRVALLPKAQPKYTGSARVADVALARPFAHRQASRDLTIEIDGKPIDFDVKPTLLKGVAFAPFRQIVEHSGGMVLWLPASRTVQAILPQRRVQLTIGSRRSFVDGRLQLLDHPAFLERGRTMVPVRFLQTALDLKAIYDPERGLVSLYRQ